MKIQKNSLIKSILISVFSMISVTHNHVTDSSTIFGLHSNNYIVNVISNFFVSLGTTSNLTILLLIIFTYWIIQSTNSRQFSKPISILAFLATTIMAFFANIGKIIRSNGMLNNSLSNLLLFKLLLKTLALGTLFYLIFKYLNQEVDQLSPQTQNDQTFNFKIATLTLLILWLPYYLILFPGTGSYDTVNQILETFGQGWVRDIYPIGHYLLATHPLSISNQHNFFMTLILGCFAKLGVIVFHNINFGIAIASFLQMLFAIISICYALDVLNKLGCQYKMTKLLFYFYALFPIFPIYSIYLSKNTFYTSSMVLFIALLMQFCSNSNIIKSKQWQSFLLIDVVCQLISEKYAIYVLLFVLIYLVIFYRSHIKEWIKLFFIPIAIFQLCIVNLMFPLLKVPNGDPIEGLSVPIQQTALCVKQHGNELNEHQRKIINKVFVLNNLSSLYNPNRSDPIKSSGAKTSSFKLGYRYKTVTSKDIKAYKILWLQMMLKYPKTYLEALINLNYQYLDVNTKQVNTMPSSDHDSFPLYFVNSKIPTKNKSVNYIQQNQLLLPVRKLLALIFNICNKIPPISLLLSGTAYIWLIIYIFIVSVRFTKKRYILPFLPILLQIPIIMLSPIDNSQRYMYPIIFSAIIFVGLLSTILIQKESQNS